MKKVTLLKNPISVNDLKLDDLYDDISGEWQLRAERISKRTERQMRLTGV